jgi:Uri superfamily endonuclease
LRINWISPDDSPAEALTPEPGSYALLLRLDAPVCISVGRLGRFDFPAGTYVYPGSAHGPGGLRARLGRHLIGHGRVRWHVDYLRQYAVVIGAVYVTEPRAMTFGRRAPAQTTRMAIECLWGQALAGLPGATIPIPGFGASDCASGCQAHLLHFAKDSASVRRACGKMLSTLKPDGPAFV